MNEERNLLTEASNLLEDLEPILRKGIDSLYYDLNPQTGMLQQLLQQEIELQEELLARIQETSGRIDDFLNPDQDLIHPAGPLNVIMSNGEQIRLRYGSDTFIEAIERLGIERVKRLGIKYGQFPVVGTEPHRYYRRSEDYYIMVCMSTKSKKEKLEEIAGRLEVMLQVEISNN